MEKQREEIVGSPRLYTTNQAFSVSWFDACLEETLLPGKPWYKVLEKLEAAFAIEVKNQIRNSKQREVVFHLLGQNFVNKYFDDCSIQPDLLTSIDMSEASSIKLVEATGVWLQNLCVKAAESIHYQFHFDTDATELAPEMLHFLDDTYSIVTTEMEWLLATCRARCKESGVQENETLHEVPQASLSRQRPKSIESKDIRLVLSKRPISETSRKEKGSPKHIRPELHPPVLSCPESDILGDVLCAIISRDLENMLTVCRRLRGKLLPKTLRQFIWVDNLLRAGSEHPKTHGLKFVEREARESFGRTVTQRIAEMKLHSATRSLVSGLIENAVVEMYERVPCLRPFSTDEQIILESSRTLNVLYVFNGTYEPYLIQRLFPLQLVFKQTMTKAEHPYELAMYLHSLQCNLFPSWRKIFAMAESVMGLLEQEDGEFFAHLQHTFKKNITTDPKDFLVELLVQERGISTFQNRFQPRPNVTKELLASPVIFLRKWMGEGFVGVLNLPAVLLIWDQMFLQDWKLDVMRDFCAAILLLLRDSFMAADDYQEIREVFLSCPVHLLTADIRRAWIHLQQGGLLADVPGLNRLNQRLLVDLFPLRHSSAEAGKNHMSTREIPPIGVKNVLLKIALPDCLAEISQPEFSVQNVDPSALKLTVSVCCGSEKLRSKTVSFNSSSQRKTQEKTGHLREAECTFHFNESIVFDSLDLMDFINVQDSKPYLLLKIVDSPKGKDPLTVGWQKVDAFLEETTDFGMTCIPQDFSALVPLNLGEVPDTVAAYPFRWLPNDFAQGHPTIQLTVYDVAKERRRGGGSQAGRERLHDSSFLYAPWVPHDPSVVLPDPPRTNQPFDLYIDALHYIPDNATITKVTGHFRNSGLSNVPHIVAFPVLESSARNPEFQYRAAISRDAPDGMDKNTWLLFQVHTVDVDLGDHVLLGSCVIRVFNAEGELNVGGFQLRLKAGLLENGPFSLSSSSLNHHPAIPCCTLLVRLLPHTEIPVPPPGYLTGYYFTDGAKPSNSELRIISSFQNDLTFPKHVLDMVTELMNKEQIRVPVDQLQAWCVEKLDERGHLSPQSFLKCINVQHAVRYRQEAGIHIRIKQAFGLKDGYYVNTLSRIFKGAASMQLPELSQCWGGEEKFLTRQLDFSSLQSSPRWTDPSVVLHPYLDDHTVLLVQVYGLDAVYIPDPSGQNPGEVMPRSGQVLELNAQSQLGWTVLPLFERRYVRSGVHSVPLFQGTPSAEFLRSIVIRPAKDIMAESLRNRSLKLLRPTYGSVAIEMWDGHYSDEECPELPVVNDLLGIDKMKKFLATQASKKGKDMSQLVLKTLDRKLRKLGCNSLEYQRQEHLYKQAMGNAFYSVVETALLNAGYGPL